MNNKTVLISGAAGNLGQALALHFLNKGWNVAALVHHPTNQNPISENHKEFEVDLLDEASAKNCVAQVLKAFGQIDVAVLTAGGFAMGDLENTNMQNIEQQIQLNFATAYNVAQPLAAYFKSNGGGKIFFTGSGQGMDTRKGKAVVAYSLSKSLLFQLANIINADSEATKVVAYVVVPNTIDTPQNREGMPHADFSKWQKPEEIASIIDNYVSEEGFSDNHEIVIQQELKTK